MYRHAWESILSFCDLLHLTRAARIQRMTLSAVREMHSIKHKIVCGFRELPVMHKHAVMARHIGDVEIQVPFLTVFQAVIKKGYDITIVNLCYWGLCDGSTQERIVEALHSLEAIRELRLAYCNLVHRGIELLSQYLAINSSITYVDLTYNNIRHESMKIFSKALKYNTSITSILLDDNKMDDVDMVHLADALRRNTTIQHISLKSNMIQCAGAAALANTLETNRTITSMNLHDNLIGLQGTMALEKALRTNATVTEFHIHFDVTNKEEDSISVFEALRSRFGSSIELR